MTPAASRRSNIGNAHISQSELRGCGSSVNSSETAHPCRRQYSICARIWVSVRSGRNEKVPCVMRIESSSRSGRGGNEVGRVGRGVVERNLSPDVERSLERLAMARRLDQDLRTFVPDVATFVARQHHSFQSNSIS